MNETDADQRNKDRKVYQLLDIVAEEVSDVDRAANQRTYLVVKRRNDMNENARVGSEVVEDGSGSLTAVHKAKGNGAQDDDEHGKSGARPDKEEDKSKQALVIPGPVKQALVRTGAEVLERLTSVLDAIKSAKETDEKLDRPMPDSVARELRSISQLLTGVLERYPSPAAKDDDGEPSGVTKKGAKLAGKRRDQLQSAIELLQKLLEDVLPEKSAPGGAATGDRGTDPNRANVGAGVQPDQDAARSAQEVLGEVPGLADVLKSIHSLGEALEELGSKVQGQDQEIARLKKSTGMPASREVDSVRRPKPPEPVSWPLDMNQPLSREGVAEEVSFFDS